MYIIYSLSCFDFSVEGLEREGSVVPLLGGWGKWIAVTDFFIHLPFCLESESLFPTWRSDKVQQLTADAVPTLAHVKS